MTALSCYIFCGSGYLFLLGVKACLAAIYAAQDRGVEVGDLKPASLTVAQPILSGDPGLSAMLEGNLSSLNGQHFLWLCDETDAEAIQACNGLIEKHPDEQITLKLCPPCPPGVNPKVFKLTLVADSVSTPFFIVLDDDTHLPARTAAVLVHHARHHDIATGLPRYMAAKDLPSALLSQFVNNNSAMTYLATLPFMRPLSINGMCYVMKTENVSLFPQILHHLTDDLALATLIRNNCGTIHQSSHPQLISTGVKDLRHYSRLMHRWNLFALLLVKGQTKGSRALICLLHGWHPLLLWTMLLMLLCHPSLEWVGIFIAFLLSRMLLLAGLQLWIFRGWIHQPFISLVSEMAQPLHLIHALVDRHIIWRSRRYHVHASDHFEADE